MPEDTTLTAANLNALNMVDGKGSERHKQRRIYREYYDGEHATQLTERQRRYLSIKTGEEFNSNYCPTVVDALAEKLSLVGFKTGEKQGKILWDWWQQNRMDATQRVVHLSSIRDGDSFIMVGFDNDKNIPTMTFEMAYDGTQGVDVRYSTSKRAEIDFAFKKWKTADGIRVNLYFKDRIEKYFHREASGDVALPENTAYGQWQKYTEPGKEWPEKWEAKDGSPLGVSVIHFKNKDRGYNYGRSELHNVIPLQNALNKAIIDTVAAADTTGFRVYWMTGGDPGNQKVTPGCFLYSKESGTQIGYFPGEDLSKLIDFKDAFAMEIARVSRTPVSYFQMSKQLAGEGTLQQQESGLVSRAKDRQQVFGNAWEDVMVMARRLWNTFGGKDALDENELIESTWLDPETRNDKAFLEEMKLKKELGVPIDVLWAEMGYSSEDIEDMKKSVEYQAMIAMAQLGLGDASG